MFLWGSNYRPGSILEDSSRDMSYLGSGHWIVFQILHWLPTHTQNIQWPCGHFEISCISTLDWCMWHPAGLSLSENHQEDEIILANANKRFSNVISSKSSCLAHLKTHINRLQGVGFLMGSLLMSQRCTYFFLFKIAEQFFF